MHELTISGSAPTRQVTLTDGRHIIGRMEENEIPLLEGDGISREHAAIEIDGDTATIVDLESRNGTWVGGSSIQKKQLKQGDEIRIGGYTLVYKFVAETALQALPKEREIPGLGDKTELTDMPLDDELENFAPAPIPSSLFGAELQAPSPDAKPAAQPTRKIILNFKARLIAAFLLMVGVCVLFLSSALTSLAEDKMALEALSRARTLTYLLAEMNVEKLQAGDIRLITEPIAQERGAQQVLLLDVHGQVIAPDNLKGKTKPEWTKAHEKAEFLNQLTPNGAILSVPVASAGRRYGTAILDFSVDYLKENKAEMGRIAMFLGLFLAIVAVGLALFLERLCHKPFLTLAAEVDLVIKQDLNAEIPMTTDKKANQLCDAMNRLIQRAKEDQEGKKAGSDASQHANKTALKEMADTLCEAALLINEDGLLEFCNQRAVDDLQCDFKKGQAIHLIDAFGSSPYRGDILSLIKDVRQHSGKLISRNFKGKKNLRARAKTIDAEGGLLTLLSFEHSR